MSPYLTSICGIVKRLMRSGLSHPAHMQDLSPSENEVIGEIGKNASRGRKRQLAEVDFPFSLIEVDADEIEIRR